ncbi:MAG: YsnF/AvaK domain-containing protein [Microcoleaceae cyanobacterium]
MANLKGSFIVRDDGIRGRVVGEAEAGRLIVEFDDRSRMVVSPDILALQPDGSYRLSLASLGLSSMPTTVATEEEVVIPVIAEELRIETQQVARGVVRVHKRVETWEEVVDAPTVHEEVVVEHVSINQFVGDVVPEVREENGVLIIPLIEEVVVVETRLLLREEVRISKRRTTENIPQTITLRREVVDIERTEFSGTETEYTQGN